ncbi:MAG TPA: type II secretion system ATPase GspE [Geminicoccaceae bacterium]
MTPETALASADEELAFDETLGQLLIERGKLDPQALQRAQRARSASRERLHVLLPKLGLVAERDVAEALAALLELPLAEEGDYPDAPLHGDRVSVNFLKQARILPLSDNEAGLAVAMADPLDRYTIGAMQLFAGKPVLPWVGVPSDIDGALERIFGRGGGLGEIVQEIGADELGADDDVQRLRDLASEAPVVRLVNRLISRAVESRASDIHIEPFEQTLRVRYRVDGVLREVEAPPTRFAAAVLSRIKIMARLNIAERRLPQDGRIRLAVRGKDIDLRVATIPTMHGEAVVLRVLDRGSVQLDFDILGFDAHTLEAYRSALARPNGIILVTGPTGSGKTTTLYTSLLELNTPDKKILTVEDPIEYQLHGINQVQIKPQIGLSFAHVLRSMLRHDPDIIMVGEIRDLETAEISIQAALTGHLVLSTLHTNNAAGTLTRLLDMGVEDYLLSSTLNAVVAQRLVRKLCGHCREPFRPLPELLAQLGLEDRPEPTFWRPRGCPSCGDSGFFGRIGINEVLVMNEAISRQVLNRAEAGILARTAVEHGMRPMFQDGLNKVRAGVTTVEEVLRVTREVE